MTIFHWYWEKLGSRCESAFKGLILFCLAAYRTIGTSHLGGSCRFEPSCSHYAVEALRTHSSYRALPLIIRRIGKCRPGGPFGWDPVPPIKGNL